MKCGEALQKLADYSYGELSSADEISIAVHLRDCPGCYITYQELLAEDELYANYTSNRDIEVTPDMWQQVSARISLESTAGNEKQNFLTQPSRSKRDYISENIFTFIEVEPFWLRFAITLRDAGREFAADPKGFLDDLCHRDPIQTRRKQFLRRGAAVAMVVWLSTSVAYLAWIYRFPVVPVAKTEAIQKVYDITALVEPINLPNKGERAGGGGGGGNHELTPPSQGRLPQASMRDPMVSPTTHPPEIENPSLPIIPTVQVDPSLIAEQPTDIPLGLPSGIPEPPSDGPGSNGGIGISKGGGMGSGTGTGFGPGNEKGTNGGDYNPGNGDVDSERVYPVDDPTVKAPQIIAREKPKYTEDARIHKIQGTVVLMAIFRYDGTVTDIKVVSGLGYGLDEEAIKAIAKTKFIPASRAGRNVSVRAHFEYTFSLL